MKAAFTFTLHTPEKTCFEGEAFVVSLATEDGGEMEILAHHASLTGAVRFSPVKIKKENKEETFIVRNGIIAFDNAGNRGALLAYHCEKRSEISLKTAQEYLEFLNARLAKHESLNAFQVHHLEGERIAVEEQIAHGEEEK